MTNSGLAKGQVHSTAVHSLSRLFCNTRMGNQDWCSINLIRIMAQTSQLCRAFSTKPWIDLLLSFISPLTIVGGNEINLPKQIQALRLLKIVLQSWDMDSSDIQPLLEKLLIILGRIILTCCYDVSNKPLPDSKTLVLLTQSHSHTLAQEIINLLRNLYGLVGWNQILNSILLQKLNVAVYLLSDNCLMSNANDNAVSEQQYLVTACLNIIGAYDSRPRVGAIVEMDSRLGTIVRVTQTRKLCVQIHNSGENKKVSFSSLKLVMDNQFNLDRMPLSENLVKIWASLLINKYNISSNSYERKSSHGQIDLTYLRTQQNILSALNATRVLYSYNNQYKLRKILKR